jgi:hypothetical protein
MTTVAHEALSANHEEFNPAIKELRSGNVAYISPDAPTIDGWYDQAVENSAYDIKPIGVVEWKHRHGTRAWGLFEHGDTVSVVPLVPKEGQDGARFFDWASAVDDSEDFSGITLGITHDDGQFSVADVMFWNSQDSEDEGRRKFCIRASTGNVRVIAEFSEATMKLSDDDSQQPQDSLPESQPNAEADNGEKFYFPEDPYVSYVAEELDVPGGMTASQAQKKLKAGEVDQLPAAQDSAMESSPATLSARAARVDRGDHAPTELSVMKADGESGRHPAPADRSGSEFALQYKTSTGSRRHIGFSDEANARESFPENHPDIQKLRREQARQYYSGLARKSDQFSNQRGMADTRR